MAHSHCPPMDYTEATLKLGGGKNGAFSFSSYGLQPKVVSHDKVASNRKSTTNFIFIHYRQNFQWVDAPLRLGVAGMAHSHFFLPTMVSPLPLFLITAIIIAYHHCHIQHDHHSQHGMDDPERCRYVTVTVNLFLWLNLFEPLWFKEVRFRFASGSGPMGPCGTAALPVRNCTCEPLLAKSLSLSLFLSLSLPSHAA